MADYRTKLINRVVDRIVADIEMDILHHLETLVAKLIESKENRKVIEEYLAG